jgi:hypothetical protein
MALYKPDWLRTAIDWLPDSIFGIPIKIGETLEKAVDWMLGWVNSLVEWAIQVSAWFEDIITEIREAFDLFTQGLNTLWQELVNFKDTLFSLFESWLAAAKDTVLGWVAVVRDWLLERIADVRTLVDTLGVRWDNFWNEILPGLVSFDALEDRVKQLLADLSAPLNVLLEFKDKIVAFFSDPLEWLLEMFTDWFLGEE